MTILWVGLASGVICLALAEGGIFDPWRSRLRGKWANLASCPLCLGAWVCAALWVYQGLPPGVSAPVAWGASWAVSTAVSFGLLRLSD